MFISFRDPAGRLFHLRGRLIRLVFKDSVEDLRSFLASRTQEKFLNEGKLVQTTVIHNAVEIWPAIEAALSDLPPTSLDNGLIVEHEIIPFRSFPYEWPPEMLVAAAELTIDLAESLLPEGQGLKDATPYNILFRGPKPVFVDALSFERRDPSDPIWRPYAQFVRTFLLPLLVNQSFGLRLDQLLIAHRDGLEPEQVYSLCGFWRRLGRPFLALVSIPSWLARDKDRINDETLYQPKRESNQEKALFIFNRLLKRLRRRLRQVLAVAPAKSEWSEYMTDRHAALSDEYLNAKGDFVKEVLEEFRPGRVLDIGCNTGHFSAIAAQAGSQVVAIDSDPIVVGHVWRSAVADGHDILPLVVNFTRPSPSIGWRNRECPSFIDRARGGFDAVMMLAVVHHMVVGELVPLREVIELAAELTNNLLIIEYIAPEDPMFRKLTRGRSALFGNYNQEFFEQECGRIFEVVRRRQLGAGARIIYLLKKINVG